MSKKDDDRGERKGGGEQHDGRYQLTVPIDASDLEELREDQPQDLQVVARLTDGTTVTETVKLDDGKGVATLTFEQRPDAVGVYLGPDRATAEELQHSQTITVNVPASRWAETPAVELNPIRVPPYYWIWWYRWCRTFVVRGRLLCPDGYPVPGAEVCASDIDGFGIWSSRQQVGCDTTDEHGAFEIRFRWCCGFWPYWWWHNRVWRSDPLLTERVGAAIEREPDLSLARVGTQPSLDLFADVLENQPVALDQPLQELSPGQIEGVRERLIERLPEIPELRRLRIWPWYPWYPWWDCTPDIVFEATQDGEVILEEGFLDTRWNIDTNEWVVLTANDEAMCITPECDQPPCPGGECLLITAVCGLSIDRIGGNYGTPAPDGYLDPGTRDRPFAETVSVSRNATPLQNVDYIELEHFTGSDWDPVPSGALVNFVRRYYDSTAPPGSRFRNANFAPTIIGGHTVVETREHYEVTNAPTWWGEPGPTTAWWTRNRDMLVRIDSNLFADGTHRFRVVGWDEAAGGDDLTNRRELTRCDEDEDVEFVLTFDNRLEDDPAHPTSDTHRCGDDTVHLCVTEPDTDIISVTVNGTPLDPCDITGLDSGTVEIEFFAHDPDGHLGGYELRATYAENEVRDLLAQPHTITPVPSPSMPSLYEGPTYADAVSPDQGGDAIRPHWRGGRYRITLATEDAFPDPCCYQLELEAWKRTVVNCSGDNPHWNRSHYTIGLGI